MACSSKPPSVEIHPFTGDCLIWMKPFSSSSISFPPQAAQLGFDQPREKKDKRGVVTRTHHHPSSLAPSPSTTPLNTPYDEGQGDLTEPNKRGGEGRGKLEWRWSSSRFFRLGSRWSKGGGAKGGCYPRGCGLLSKVNEGASRHIYPVFQCCHFSPYPASSLISSGPFVSPQPCCGSREGFLVEYQDSEAVSRWLDNEQWCEQKGRE